MAAIEYKISLLTPSLTFFKQLFSPESYKNYISSKTLSNTNILLYAWVVGILKLSR